MRKYFIKNNGDEKLIELINDSKAMIDGKEYDYKVKFISNEFVMLRLNNKNFFLKVTRDENEPGILLIESRGDQFKLSCRDELSKLIEEMGYGNKDERHRSEIHSPMPGIIVKLNAGEGQSLKKGDVLLVLEAMKMENEIRATRDCVVKKVNVSEKKSVEKGELLIVLE